MANYEWIPDEIIGDPDSGLFYIEGWMSNDSHLLDSAFASPINGPIEELIGFHSPEDVFDYVISFNADFKIVYANRKGELEVKIISELDPDIQGNPFMVIQDESFEHLDIKYFMVILKPEKRKIWLNYADEDFGEGYEDGIVTIEPDGTLRLRGLETYFDPDDIIDLYSSIGEIEGGFDVEKILVRGSGRVTYDPNKFDQSGLSIAYRLAEVYHRVLSLNLHQRELPDFIVVPEIIPKFTLLALDPDDFSFYYRVEIPLEFGNYV